MFSAKPAHAAIALVQTTSTAANAGNTVSVQLTTTSGNTLIVVAGSRNNGTISIGDTASNTFTLIQNATFNFGSSYVNLYYAKNIAGGSDTVTLTDNVGSGHDKHLQVFQYSGLSATNPLDQSTSTTSVVGSGLGIATTTLTTTSSPELLFAAAMVVGVSESSFTAPTGYTVQATTNVSGDSSVGSEDQTVSSAGAQTASMSWTPGAIGTGNGGMDFATFEAAPPTAPTNVSGYAWGNKIGWINFGTSLGGLEVYSSTIQGYAWTENHGWINFGPLPSSTGVVNDGHGNLSGYAWSENLGYINFQGVSIDSNGVFHGVASGTIAGSIQFDSSGGCTYCEVTTTWTPPVGASLTISSVAVDGTNPSTITLTPDTTTNVNVEATVTDTTCSEITGGTTTILFYRSGVASSSCLTGSGNGASPNLNCYTATVFTASSTCSAGTINTTTTFPVQYFAQATDASSSFPNQNWIATVIFNDAINATSSADSTYSTSSNVISTLTAINITTSSINYGSVAPSSTTGSVNQTTIVQNAGNSSTTLQLSGTGLTNGSNVIATSSQAYSTSTFTYAGTSTALTANPVTVSGFLLASPTSTTNVQSTIYWGLAVPNGSATGTYTGTNTFASVFSS